jgi:hypothetical protein
MKNKQLFIILSMILLLSLSSNLVLGELTLWSNVIIDANQSTVTKHGYIQLYNDINKPLQNLVNEVSKEPIMVDRPVKIFIDYQIQNLTFNLTGDGGYGSVDWCNLTIVANTHESISYPLVPLFPITINFSEQIDTLFFESTNTTETGRYTYIINNRDDITIDLTCHYTDSRDVFFDSIIFGDFFVYTPAMECNNCEKMNLEQLSYEVERNDEITAKQNEIYLWVSKIIGFNYTIWLIGFWITRLFFLLLAISLIFLGVYSIYKMFKDIEEKL